MVMHQWLSWTHVWNSQRLAHIPLCLHWGKIVWHGIEHRNRWSSGWLSGSSLEALKINSIVPGDDRGLPDDSSAPVNVSQCGMMNVAQLSRSILLLHCTWHCIAPIELYTLCANKYYIYIVYKSLRKPILHRRSSMLTNTSPQADHYARRLCFLL